MHEKCDEIDVNAVNFSRFFWSNDCHYRGSTKNTVVTLVVTRSVNFGLFGMK